MLIAALLAFLASAPAGAQTFPSCLRPASGEAPSTLDELRDCQDRARAAAVAAAESAGKPLTGDERDGLDDFQRAEARKFLAAPGQVVEGAPAPAPAAQSKGLGGVAPADLARTDTGSAAAVSGLQGRLQASAGDGAAGVTPAMAADITATLLSVQGTVSPDMRSLLNATVKDGATLTPDTMKLLQGGSRAAKGSGLDLGIDPSVEKALLKEDFDADKPAFNAAQPPAAF